MSDITPRFHRRCLKFYTSGTLHNSNDNGCSNDVCEEGYFSGMSLRGRWGYKRGSLGVWCTYLFIFWLRKVKGPGRTLVISERFSHRKLRRYLLSDRKLRGERQQYLWPRDRWTAPLFFTHKKKVVLLLSDPLEVPSSTSGTWDTLEGNFSLVGFLRLFL